MTRLPLRMVPQAKLQAAWTAGRPFYTDYERREPRALALEKPVEEMTLDELTATQNMEPLSESRRMFLHLGPQAKVLSGNLPVAGGVHELFEYVPDAGPKCLFDAIDLDIAEDEAPEPEPMFTPYNLIDIITARQIEWEKIQAASSATARVRIGATPNGRLTVEPVSRIYDDFTKIVKSAVSAVFTSLGRVETLEDLHARVDLLADVLSDPAAGLYHSADAREERERALADAERGARYGIEHSSFEELVVDEETGDETLLIHHRSPRQSEWELWHNQLQRHSADPYEIGTYLCSNDELEALLGVTEWDAEGNALDPSREALLEATA